MFTLAPYAVQVSVKSVSYSMLQKVKSMPLLSIAVIHNLTDLGDMAGAKDYLYQAANGLRILGATDPFMGLGLITITLLIFGASLNYSDLAILLNIIR